MAKRARSRTAWRWPGKVRAATWLVVFWVVLCPGNLLCAGDLVASNALSQSATAIGLEYQETAYGILNWSVSITPSSASFKKEPTAVSGNILRGVLNFGGESSNSIAFIWQRGAGKLYLDLNRNGDLTDDPAGAFSARGAERYFQTFTNVHLLFNTAAGKCPVLADLEFWDSGVLSHCTVELRSFWQGRVTLQGRDWQVGVIPNFSSVSFQTGQLLLRPWRERDKAFNAYAGSLDTSPFSRKIFVDGHAYQLTCQTGPQNGEVKPELQFTEQPVALGEMKIIGKFIQRLVLPGGPYLVELDRPAGTVRIPIGSYNQPRLRLAEAGTEASCDASQSQPVRPITVNGRTTAVLAVGGPLTNTVIATRHGRDLRLDYRLIGAGGETYGLANRDYAHPPQFAVYKGDRKIASGNFEFG